MVQLAEKILGVHAERFTLHLTDDSRVEQVDDIEQRRIRINIDAFDNGKLRVRWQKEE